MHNVNNPWMNDWDWFFQQTHQIWFPLLQGDRSTSFQTSVCCFHLHSLSSLKHKIPEFNISNYNNMPTQINQIL